jgi:hypothetical protein
MTRFEVAETDAHSNVRRAVDCATGEPVILERGLRAERVRRFNRIPPSGAIALHRRTRLDRRVQLVHPAPLELEVPTDDFDIAHAIGSLLDGLAWLHDHDFTHGAIDELALTNGPTGGRLSMVGALSRRGDASKADDVFAAAALAYVLIVGEPPGPEAHEDPRLDFCTSPAMTEGVRAGLHPDAERRPSALELATMVRGEWLLPVTTARSLEHPIARVRALFAGASMPARCIADTVCRSLSPPAARLSAGLGAAAALLVVLGTLAAADGPDRAFADGTSGSQPTVVAAAIGLDAPDASVDAARSTRVSLGPGVAVEDLIASAVASLAPPTTIEVLAHATVAASLPPPTTVPTTAAPPPPSTVRATVPTTAPPPTTAAPPTVAAPTTSAPTTSAPTTTRVASTTRATTTRITTTTRAPTTTRATTTTRRNRGGD